MTRCSPATNCPPSVGRTPSPDSARSCPTWTGTSATRPAKYKFADGSRDSPSGFPTLLSRREIFQDVPDMVDDIATKAFTVNGKEEMGLIMYIINAVASHTSVAELTDFASTVLEAF